MHASFSLLKVNFLVSRELSDRSKRKICDTPKDMYTKNSKQTHAPRHEFPAFELRCVHFSHFFFVVLKFSFPRFIVSPKSLRNLVDQHTKSHAAIQVS